MEGILWLLIFGALFYFMMRYGCGAHMVHGGHGSRGSGGISHGIQGARFEGIAGTIVKDPVCGMEIAPDSGYSRMFQGRMFRFCSRKCLDQFDARPEQYIG